MASRKSISFFERVAFEDRAANERATPAGEGESSVALAARQRTVLFFVDDLHLSASSLVQTRRALLDFVKDGMGPNDQVAITSSSGQIGFLQQFTGDRTVLQSAVARLNYRANAKFDMEKPPMSEYMAGQNSGRRRKRDQLLRGRDDEAELLPRPSVRNDLHDGRRTPRVTWSFSGRAK